VTGVYHRYFSHRTYKTSRGFQFLLALLAMSSSQKGVLWWGAHHRHHHKYSDMPEDIHSPKQKGFWYAHVGWLFDQTEATDYSKIKDFARYPELVFLNKFWWIPPTALGFIMFVTMGWSGLLIGFALSTVLLWHGTYTINSLTHVFGKRVYETTDDSRNSFILALITLGEGWHNNHHYYQASTRQGFHWWQLDITYYVLRGLQAVGLIWDIREPPAAVVEGSWQPSKHRPAATVEAPAELAA
jgi:stearoyl-CoA desaturase (delta-9 desaturase)